MLPLLTLITLPADFMATTTAYIGTLFTDVWVVVALVVGLPLAFWVIRRIVGLVRLRG